MFYNCNLRPAKVAESNESIHGTKFLHYFCFKKLNMQKMSLNVFLNYIYMIEACLIFGFQKTEVYRLIFI